MPHLDSSHHLADDQLCVQLLSLVKVAWHINAAFSRCKQPPQPGLYVRQARGQMGEVGPHGTAPQGGTGSWWVAEMSRGIVMLRCLMVSLASFAA
jgi:hypothetical protein